MPDHLSVFGQTAPLQALIRRSLASSHAHICIRQDIFRRLTFAYIRSPYKWQKPRFYRGFLSEYLFYSLMMASMYKKDILPLFLYRLELFISCIYYSIFLKKYKCFSIFVLIFFYSYNPQQQKKVNYYKTKQILLHLINQY